MGKKYYIVFEGEDCCYISKEKPIWIENLQTYQMDSLAYIERNLFKILFPEIAKVAELSEKIILEVIIVDGKMGIKKGFY